MQISVRQDRAVEEAITVRAFRYLTQALPIPPLPALFLTQADEEILPNTQKNSLNSILQIAHHVNALGQALKQGRDGIAHASLPI